MFRWRKSRASRYYIAGLCTGLLVGAGMLVGALATTFQTRPDGPFSPQVLRASSASAGDSLAMATGPIDRGVEGIFFLDGLTGKLQGAVLNPQTGGTMGAFICQSVYSDLNIGEVKNPKLIMVTGVASGNGIAESIVYVAETTSGNWAAYAVPWNRQAPKLKIAQAVPLVLVGTGKARDVAIR